MLIKIVIAAAVILAALLVYGYCSNFRLKTECYNVPVPGMAEGKSVRIVMLADLHGSSFGRKNQRLIEKIKAEQPDMVCIAGDMTVKDGKGVETALALCREMVSVCPVYYVAGNHEVRMDCYREYCADLRKMGVIFLDNEHRDFFICRKKFTVYGWNAGEMYYRKFWEEGGVSAEELEEQMGTPDPMAFCILLAHNPEYFDVYREWGAQLVLSGHVHGGIARLPLAGGVISPSLRLFPKYDAGLYKNGASTMILTRGLGTHHIRLRFFNIPEISVLNLSNLLQKYEK